MRLRGTRSASLWLTDIVFPPGRFLWTKATSCTTTWGWSSPTTRGTTSSWAKTTKSGVSDQGKEKVLQPKNYVQKVLLPQNPKTKSPKSKRPNKKGLMKKSKQKVLKPEDVTKRPNDKFRTKNVPMNSLIKKFPKSPKQKSCLKI